jgi:hypothetical protein
MLPLPGRAFKREHERTGIRFETTARDERRLVMGDGRAIRRVTKQARHCGTPSLIE